MEIKRTEFKGIKYSFIGSPLEENANRVIFYYGAKVGAEFDELIKMSAIEAVANGFEIVSNGSYRSRKELSKIVLFSGGKISHIEYKGLGSLGFKKWDCYDVLSGGCVFSFLNDEKEYSLDGQIYSNSALLTVADKILFLGAVPPYIISEALDLGYEAAALKCFLYEKSVRNFALSGGAMIDSFSSWLTLSNSIAYKDGSGNVKLLKFR